MSSWRTSTDSQIQDRRAAARTLKLEQRAMGETLWSTTFEQPTPPSPPALLVACARQSVSTSICDRFRAEGYTVLSAATGEEALRKVSASQTALVLIDLALPAASGLEVCKRIKMNPLTSTVPVILLSARRHQVDRIVGFEIGADDCADIRCDPRELTLRVKAVLRRIGWWATRSITSVGPIAIDLAQCAVRVNGREVHLTATEFRMLVLLTSRAGVVQSRNTLLREVWGDDLAIDGRSVDTYLRRLRSKMGDAARYLKTVRGLGYYIVADPAAASR